MQLKNIILSIVGNIPVNKDQRDIKFYTGVQRDTEENIGSTIYKQKKLKILQTCHPSTALGLT